MQVFNLSPGDHDRAQALLPWYVTGSLDAQDRSAVESHLLACPQCQADLSFERRLSAEVSGLSVAAEQGWASLLPRLEAARARPQGRALAAGVAEALARLRRSWSRNPAWVGGALAAQLCLVAVFAGLALTPRTSPAPARYVALGAGRASPPANLVVIFRPDTRESELRAILRQVDARIVGGPTAADAYLLQAPPETRASALARLRARDDIALAEPVDAATP